MKLPITPLRKKLDDLANEKRSVDGIAGIVLLEKGKTADHMRGINCVVYCFGRNNLPEFKIIGQGANSFVLTTGGCREVRKHEIDDLVVYIADDGCGGREQTHIGRAVDDSRVKSKWGYGNVYLHNIECVPACYGEEVRFFRKK